MTSRTNKTGSTTIASSSLVPLKTDEDQTATYYTPVQLEEDGSSVYVVVQETSCLVSTAGPDWAFGSYNLLTTELKKKTSYIPTKRNETRQRKLFYFIALISSVL